MLDYTDLIIWAFKRDKKQQRDSSPGVEDANNHVVTDLHGWELRATSSPQQQENGDLSPTPQGAQCEILGRDPIHVVSDVWLTEMWDKGGVLF